MVDFLLLSRSVPSVEETIKESDFTNKSNIETAIAAASILTPQRLAQNRLVLRVLDECFAKLKLSMIIPKIFENPLTVLRLLKGTQYEFLAEKLLKYLRTHAKNGINEEYVEPELYNEKLIEVINDFHVNFDVIDLLPNWFSETAIADHSIMEAFDLLAHITDERLHRSAIMELEKEKNMHNFYLENAMLKKEIELLRRQVRNRRHQMRWKLAIRTGDSQKFQEELTLKKWQNFNLIRQEKKEQGQRVKQYSFGHSNKVQQLEQEAVRLADEFQKVKLQNAKQLKQVRDEKNKLLIQLQGVIEKHDRVLGEKIKENVYLQCAYDKLRVDLESFLARCAALGKEYNELINAERIEQLAKWQEKAKFFFHTRAAKKIQRAWRRSMEERRLAALQAKKASRKSVRKSAVLRKNF